MAASQLDSPPSAASRVALPIDASMPEVVAAVRQHRSVILLAEPGAGKSTRVPIELARTFQKELPGKWLVLQPRRWAAKLVASRIAEENGLTIGKEVGYQVRFDSKVSSDTAVVLMTEGVLLRRLSQSPELEGIAGVILDEFHERNLDSDLSLAFLKEIQENLRPELRIVVMSATLDPAPLQKFLLESKVISVSGRTFPVRHHYLGEVRPRDAIQKVLDQVSEGDVLYFLPGAFEIERAVQEIREWIRDQGEHNRIEVLPLYSTLPDAEQKRVFEDQKRLPRRIICSTNIAETSITLPRIRAVIDAGWAKVMRTDPQLGQDRLETLRISLASAEQRAGRAGRVGPGDCFRLWTEGEHSQLRHFETPEVHRVGLSQAVLWLADAGIRNPEQFAWFEAPRKSMLDFSKQELTRLQLIDETGAILPKGRLALRIPLPPRLANLVIAAHHRGCGESGARFAAWLDQAKDIDLQGVESLESVVRRLETLPQHLQRVAQQIVQALRGVEPTIRARWPECLAEILVEAVPQQVMIDGLLVGRRKVVPPQGRMLPRVGWLLRSREKTGRAPGAVAGHQHQTWIQAQAWIALELADLQPKAQKKRNIVFDSDSGRVRAQEGSFFEDLGLGPVTEKPVQPDEAFSVLVGELKDDPLKCFLKNEAFQRWMERVQFFVRALKPGASVAEAMGWDFGALLEAACLNRTRIQDVETFDAQMFLESQTPRDLLRQLEEWAPEALVVPSGSRIRLDYQQDPPKLSVRIQECFGLAETPRLAGGRVAVLMELLSPGFKPIQLTRDLKSFWNGAYFDAKKELKVQYPKHSWPDDPWTAPAVAKGRHRH